MVLQVRDNTSERKRAYYGNNLRATLLQLLDKNHQSCSYFQIGIDPSLFPLSISVAFLSIFLLIRLFSLRFYTFYFLSCKTNFLFCLYYLTSITLLELIFSIQNFKEKAKVKRPRFGTSDLFCKSLMIKCFVSCKRMIYLSSR